MRGAEKPMMSKVSLGIVLRGWQFVSVSYQYVGGIILYLLTRIRHE